MNASTGARVNRPMKALAVGVLLLVAQVAAAQSMAIPATSFPPGATITVTVTGNTSSYAQVGLYKPGAHDLNMLAWLYMNNSQAYPGIVIVNGSLQFTAPTAAGSYEFRIFAPNRGHVVGFTVGTGGSSGGGSSGSPSPGGGSSGGGSGPPSPPAVQGSIVFNGDSITAPMNITGAQNWTVQVAAGLGFAQSANLAANSKYAGAVLGDVVAMSGAAVCMVMIGTNDMIGTLALPASQARDQYLVTMRQVITALDAACGRVVILTPPMSLHPLEVLRYEKIVPALRELCAELGATFLDLFHYMADQSALQGPSVYPWWNSAGDPYHLSVAGHAMIAEFVLRSLKVTP